MIIEIRRPSKNSPQRVDRIKLRADVVESTCLTELEQVHLLHASCHGFILEDGTSIVITMEKENGNATER